MQVLVHIGLNKCGSTFVQGALDQNRARLRRALTWYPDQDGPPCQYGLSQAYGFGPASAEISPQSLADLFAQARRHDCKRLILSSEYLSLYNPGAVRRFLNDLEQLGADARFVVFSREPFAWVRSLFNQYVKTVDGGPIFRSIDGFVDQVVSNGAIDLPKRLSQWTRHVGWDRLDHYHLCAGRGQTALLHSFEAFAGIAIAEPRRSRHNASLSADALWEIGKLRQCPASSVRDSRIIALMEGKPSMAKAPDGYLEFSPGRRARIRSILIDEMRGLPVQTLPEPVNGMARAS